MLTSDRSSATSPSKGTMLFSVPPSISELPCEIPYEDTTPSTSYVQQDRELLAWQDQSTQTEWIYKSKWGNGELHPVGHDTGVQGGMHSMVMKYRGSTIASHANVIHLLTLYTCFPCHSKWYFR